MKRILGVLLITIMSFALFACDVTQGTNASVDETQLQNKMFAYFLIASEDYTYKGKVDSLPTISTNGYAYILNSTNELYIWQDEWYNAGSEIVENNEHYITMYSSGTNFGFLDQIILIHTELRGVYNDYSWKCLIGNDWTDLPDDSDGIDSVYSLGYNNPMWYESGELIIRVYIADGTVYDELTFYKLI